MTCCASRVEVVTLATPDWQAVTDLTDPAREAWCSRHGYWHRRVADRLDERPASWSKIALLLGELAKFDWVLWMDADILITNPDKPITEFAGDFDVLAASDHNGDLNCGMLLCRCSLGAFNLLRAVNATEGFTHADCCWEQEAMHLVLRGGGDWRFRLSDPRGLASFPNVWTAGDFAFHATFTVGRSAGEKAAAIRAWSALLTCHDP